MDGTITQNLETMYVHEQISQLLLASVIISKILVMRSRFQAKIKRHNGFVLEKLIHQYFSMAIKSI